VSERSYEVDFGGDGLTGAEAERLTRAGAGDAERAAESALRPRGLH
jgi:Holliday junction DNA helicase RuvB